MAPGPLHLCLTVVVDGFGHENELANNAEQCLNAIIMRIVSMNFDSKPNAILDSVLNVCSLCNLPKKNKQTNNSFEYNNEPSV